MTALTRPSAVSGGHSTLRALEHSDMSKVTSWLEMAPGLQTSFCDFQVIISLSPGTGGGEEASGR